MIRKLFKELSTSNFSAQQFEEGFLSVLESIQDYLVDVPFAWRHVADYISFAVLDKYLSVTFLNAEKKIIVGSNCGEKMIARIFSTFIEEEDNEVSRTYFKDSQVDFKEFFKPENRTEDYLANFLQENKLESLIK